MIQLNFSEIGLVPLKVIKCIDATGCCNVRLIAQLFAMSTARYKRGRRNRAMVQSHLDEYSWRLLHGGDGQDLLILFLLRVKKFYSVKMYSSKELI